MPKIDIDKIPLDTATGYPPPFDKAVEGRARKRLARAAGLTQFGVNVCRLRPGAASSQRHWHENEDELVYVLAGEVVLREDGGETVLKPGDAAAWKAGAANGHCLINRSDRRRAHRGRHPRADRARALFRHRHEGRARRQGGALYEEERRALLASLGSDTDQPAHVTPPRRGRPAAFLLIAPRC